MIAGKIIENTPLVRIAVAWGQAVQAPFVILDTGFTGDLQVSSQIAKDLGLEITGVTTVRIAGGQIIKIPVALALAVVEGAIKHVEVLISDGMPLVGISFLTKFGYRAIVDCKHKTVALEKA